MDHVIVLAGGDGRRLEGVARSRYGYARPKQFCDFGDGVTLLDRTLQRAQRLVSAERITVVTTRTHRKEASECIEAWPGVRWLEQPLNRDTLPGVTLALLDILLRDPHARIAVLPSDHGVEDDDGFVACVARAFDATLDHPFELLLLGAEVEDAEDGYGWIVPRYDRGLPRVAAFHEKPSVAAASQLRSAGALTNTLIMVGDAWTFAELALRFAPGWFHALRAGLEDPVRLANAYEALPSTGFSRAVLEPAANELRVVPLPPVGWSDVGTPERLDRALRSRAVA